MRPSRSRPRIVLALAGVVTLGLASRSRHALVPELLAEHAGDTLWTVAAYCALAFVMPRARPTSLFLAALGVSIVVELSQLVTWAPLEAARRTLPGRMLLGQGWQWADLPRYLVGAALAFRFDLVASRRAGAGERVTRPGRSGSSGVATFVTEATASHQELTACPTEESTSSVGSPAPNRSST